MQNKNLSEGNFFFFPIISRPRKIDIKKPVNSTIAIYSVIVTILIFTSFKLRENNKFSFIEYYLTIKIQR